MRLFCKPGQQQWISRFNICFLIRSITHYTFCLKVPYKTSIPEDILNIISAVVVDSKCVHNEEMIETLARCYKENKYILCPHTAVGVAYHYAQDKHDYPQVPHCKLFHAQLSVRTAFTGSACHSSPRYIS